MSGEKVEIVRKAVADWNRVTSTRLWTPRTNTPSSAPPRGWPEPVFYGKEAVRSFYEGFAETVGRNGVIEDLIDAGPVVVLEYERT